MSINNEEYYFMSKHKSELKTLDNLIKERLQFLYKTCTKMSKCIYISSE